MCIYQEYKSRFSTSSCVLFCGGCFFFNLESDELIFLNRKNGQVDSVCLPEVPKYIKELKII